MRDPRVANLARILVGYSLEVADGETCLIEGSAAGEPMIAAVYEEVLRAGGHPVALGGPRPHPPEEPLAGVAVATVQDAVVVDHEGLAGLQPEPRHAAGKVGGELLPLRDGVPPAGERAGGAPLQRLCRCAVEVVDRPDRSRGLLALFTRRRWIRNVVIAICLEGT